jgi:hypothetical protein
MCFINMIRGLVITTILFFAICESLFAQVGFVGLQVYQGGNLSYNFNTFDKYRNGVIDNDRTVVGITVNSNGNVLYSGWTLEICFADPENDGVLTGSVNNLPYSTVEVSTFLVGCATCVVPLPQPLPLTGPAGIQILLQGGLNNPLPNNLTSVSDIVHISYRIGVTTSLLGNPGDFYSDDIILTLTMN